MKVKIMSNKINQAIEDWLELCPCDDIDVNEYDLSDDNRFYHQTNFNYMTTITLYQKKIKQ